ncbi:carbon-nitrogen hydrolase family protein [Sulfurospirillum sp. 1612]|uniref:carbon-nitrogen hydrolase family protein n=1 Tax=Sulfurospirillum sp. 1612 TaxID=3094835 RepID=UPI002F93EF4E
MKLAALQLSTLPMSHAKLDYYFRICQQKEVSLVLICEYALNSFFKELETMPPLMIKEQSLHKIKVLKELSKKYNLNIVAPIVHLKGGKLLKSVARFSPLSVHYYQQQLLINYKHWNEAAFFDNDAGDISIPTFLVNKIRFGIINGFEAHFDVAWMDAMRKNVDVVLMPSSSTFDSALRWQEMIKTRAFLNSMFILRANRVGSYTDETTSWKFYGHSALVNPYGEVEVSLGHKEEILLCDINKSDVTEAKKLWGWKRTLDKKGLL